MSKLHFTPIERIPAPSYDSFYRDYDKPQRPVVITGATNGWKAMTEWSHEWFKSRYGDVDVQLSREKTHTIRATSMKIAQYIDLILLNKDQGLYMDQFSFNRIPGLTDYIATPYKNPNRHNVALNLWIGPAGTIISLHKDNHFQFDHTDNIFAQICGRKRVVLVSPDQDHLMYPRSKEEGAYWHSRVDWENPDFKRFPLFQEVKLQETVLCPGELLFIPGNYWHSLRSLDPSISVSCWWRVHRIAELVLSMMKPTHNIPVDESKITMSDVEEFGGMARFAEALISEELPPDARKLILALLKDDVRSAFNTWRLQQQQAPQINSVAAPSLRS